MELKQFDINTLKINDDKIVSYANVFYDCSTIQIV